MSTTTVDAFLVAEDVIETYALHSGTVVVTFGSVRLYADPSEVTPGELAAELRRIADELEALP